MGEKVTEANDGTESDSHLFYRLGSMALSIFDKARLAINGPDPIHPDFRMTNVIDDDLTWFQNKDWGPVDDPPYKIGFYFNDISILDNCPWVCKFGNNLNEKFSQYKYFCVGYGNPVLHRTGFGLEDMKQWAMQFDHPSLMTYSGKLLKMLKE